MANRKHSLSKRKAGRPRVADKIMSGMRELERMMDSGKSPAEMFTVRTVEVPDPLAIRLTRSARCESVWV